jgi:hypothetical protein
MLQGKENGTREGKMRRQRFRQCDLDLPCVVAFGRAKRRFARLLVLEVLDVRRRPRLPT